MPFSQPEGRGFESRPRYTEAFRGGASARSATRRTERPPVTEQSVDESDHHVAGVLNLARHAALPQKSLIGFGTAARRYRDSCDGVTLRPGTTHQMSQRSLPSTLAWRA